jgi:heme-degrading monooxygenase HmoA
MAGLAVTPDPPYYAVIFASTRTDGSPDERSSYNAAAARMIELASEQPGFLGVDSARDGEVGLTVSYWDSKDAIVAWKADAEHTVVREAGRARWYDAYELRVARVERAYGFRSG